jgi:hypothetical protein
MPSALAVGATRERHREGEPRTAECSEARTGLAAALPCPAHDHGHLAHPQPRACGDDQRLDGVAEVLGGMRWANSAIASLSAARKPEVSVRSPVTRDSTPGQRVSNIAGARALVVACPANRAPMTTEAPDMPARSAGICVGRWLSASTCTT